MTGANLCMDTRAQDFPIEKAKRMIDEAKSLRQFYLGDYYPLMDINLDERHWCGWQFDRPDLGKGIAMFFRRSQSPYTSVDADLHGLDAKAKYEVNLVDAGRKLTMTGAELAHLKVEISTAPASLLLRYRKTSR
jgi:hypothetical protein